ERGAAPSHARGGGEEGGHAGAELSVLPRLQGAVQEHLQTGRPERARQVDDDGEGEEAGEGRHGRVAQGLSGRQGAEVILAAGAAAGELSVPLPHGWIGTTS